ncbi:HPr family phosphocarrier protein [Paenibacillus larvae]|nr:HPr family phosphocarrier protein [Paenibacillus larvae]MDT2239460.1 HPr family phosphocarrier protein [Paenibacillus larvae]MDT2246104.1 HPr family phosphocarrier protein [Paenibacillus larvae]MDT2286081.1 HPr family phosphocarrier protein [Paenibacillus larvae]MDT2304076.1 HPr family phosphocarrier protein [Paenibacillus larvae]
MQKEFTVKNPMGIHARPAGEIVKKLPPSLAKLLL